MYGKVLEKFHTFFISALDVGELSDAWFGHFTATYMGKISVVS
jgi:hypothetical protein